MKKINNFNKFIINETKKEGKYFEFRVKHHPSAGYKIVKAIDINDAIQKVITHPVNLRQHREPGGELYYSINDGKGSNIINPDLLTKAYIIKEVKVYEVENDINEEDITYIFQLLIDDNLLTLRIIESDERVFCQKSLDDFQNVKVQILIIRKKSLLTFNNIELEDSISRLKDYLGNNFISRDIITNRVIDPSTFETIINEYILIKYIK